jgi:hypothetical protein
MIEHVSLRTAWLRDRINYITLQGERREVIIIAAVVGPVRWCKEGEWTAGLRRSLHGAKETLHPTQCSSGRLHLASIYPPPPTAADERVASLGGLLLACCRQVDPITQTITLLAPCMAVEGLGLPKNILLLGAASGGAAGSGLRFSAV